MIKVISNSIYIIGLLVVLSNCSSDRESEVDAVSELYASCELDSSRTFQYNNLSAASKFRQTQYVSFDAESSYLAGYDRQRHQLQFLDLEKPEELPYAISLGKEGPDALGDVVGFYVHNKDLIFVLTFRYLATLDYEGSLLSKQLINSVDASLQQSEPQKDKLFLYNSPSNSAPIYYDGSTYLYVAAKRNDVEPSEKAYYESPILSRIDVKNHTVEFLPIYYPKDYATGRFPLKDPHFTIGGGKIFYSFPNSSRVYTYSIRTEEHGSFNIASQFTSDTVPALTTSDWQNPNAAMPYISSHPTYKTIHYDSYKGLVYRFHLGPFPFDLRGNEGKQGYTHLSVFTPWGKKLSELQFPFNIQYYGAAVTPQGLLLYHYRKQPEDITSLTYFSFDCS